MPSMRSSSSDCAGRCPAGSSQGIASGLLGRASFDGGMATVLLGIAIHYFIALTVVSTYILGSRRSDPLTRAWPWCGIAYGVGVWLFMNFVVIPLSAIHRGGFTAPGVINGLLIHAFGIGLPSAWFARRAGNQHLRCGRLAGGSGSCTAPVLAPGFPVSLPGAVRGAEGLGCHVSPMFSCSNELRTGRWWNPATLPFLDT